MIHVEFHGSAWLLLLLLFLPGGKFLGEFDCRSATLSSVAIYPHVWWQSPGDVIPHHEQQVPI
jgi:hypothetical protein